MTNLQYAVMCDMYPNFKDCSIQLFDDNKNRRDSSLAKIVDASKFDSDVVAETLKKYNDKWAGIFFSVNSMIPGKRNKDSVTHINSWICECDDFTKEEQQEKIKSCPLTPSLIVESNKSYHMYWFAKDGTKENWDKICRWLCNHFWWDQQVIDISRVLRVPGFNHMKNPDEPFMCEIFDGSWEYYTEEQMLEAYPNTTSAQEIKEMEWRLEEFKRRQEKYKSDSDWAWYNINALDSMQMLEEISWHRMVNWEYFSFKRNGSGYQIIVNWKESWAWIDRNGLIGSNSNGWPTWVNWVKWYRIYDDKELYQYIKDKHPECIPERKVVEEKNEEITDEEIAEWTKIRKMENKKGFLYPSPVFDREFKWFMSKDLVTIVAPSNSGKTTFAMDIIRRNSKEHWRKCFYINLEFEIATVPTNRWLWQHWKTKMDLTDIWTLTEEDKADMDNYIADFLWQFDYYNNPDGLELSKLVSLIRKKAEEGYELFVIDTFSRIWGNLNSNTAHSSQNKCMEILHSLVQELDVAIVMLHHTNKQWSFEGSQKSCRSCLCNLYLGIYSACNIR